MEMITKTDKLKSMEQESAITLISTTVAIVSFFILLYAQSIVKTNYLKAQTFITVVDVIYAISAVATAVVAIIKKEKKLWEYAAFGAVMAIGYYFLLNPGISAFPFLYSNSNGSITITPFLTKLAELLNTTHIIYGLWAANVIYCILAIALHTVKYNKIKNTKISK